MDFWQLYRSRIANGATDGGLEMRYSDRKHTSLAMVEDRAVHLELGNILHTAYNEAKRYIIAKEISYDLLVEFYNVNNRETVALRAGSAMTEREMSGIVSVLKRIRNPNLEIRLIGLQNGYADPLAGIDYFAKKIKCMMVEVDLFGTDTRNIAIDTKTGLPYNLFLLNRIYRPGELANKTTVDEFKGSLKKLSFIKA